MDAPVFGADADPYPQERTWDTFITYRYQKSDRHFAGPHEQSFTDRATGRRVEQVRIKEGSQVINYLNLIDIAVRYNLDRRSSIGVSIPYVMIERSQTLTGPRDPDTLLRPVIDRYSTFAKGLGDITVTYRRWLLDPDTHPDWNVAAGGGIKLPTGSHTLHDTFKTLNEDGTFGTAVRPVDQSIQPGDGGLGFLLDGSFFRRFGGGRFGAYASATYLFNPEETTEGNRGNQGITEHNSVPDQYIARFGASAALWRQFGAGLGLRLEGVPTDDVFGGSDGFRRPGRAWSLEPTASWSWRRNTFSAAVPIAVYRNRQFSVADLQAGRDEPGDAAFADWLLLLGWSHRWGGERGVAKSTPDEPLRKP